jgi:hypothetical protein
MLRDNVPRGRYRGTGLTGGVDTLTLVDNADKFDRRRQPLVVDDRVAELMSDPDALFRARIEREKAYDEAELADEQA